jgi:hypothetical protein
MLLWAVSSFSVMRVAWPNESVCMSRVSITCSGGGERWRCLRRRKKRAPTRRTATRARAPIAIPTLAPIESSWWEETGAGLTTELDGVNAVVTEGGLVMVVSELIVAVVGGEVAGCETPGTFTPEEKLVIDRIVCENMPTPSVIPGGGWELNCRGLRSRRFDGEPSSAMIIGP